MLVAAAGSGAATGVAAGLLWAASGIGPLPVVVALPFLLADALLAWHGTPAPPSVRRQVPAEWTRLFSIETAASLYGARLGVGPLTILRTWTWFGAVVLAASISPLVSAVAGGVFGAARIAAVLLASGAVEADAPERMARLRSVERPAAAVFGAVALIAVVGTAVAPPGAAPATMPAVEAAFETPRATVAPDPLDEALAAALPTVLPGYSPAGPPDYAGGPLDLDAAASLEHDVDAERALLVTRGFLRGFVRSWRAPDGKDAVATVYELSGEEPASAYVADGTQTLRGRGASSFAVDSIAGASGFSQADDSGSAPRLVHAIVWAAGSRVFLVVVSGPGATPDDARVVAGVVAATARPPTAAPT